MNIYEYARRWELVVNEWKRQDGMEKIIIIIIVIILTYGSIFVYFKSKHSKIVLGYERVI